MSRILRALYLIVAAAACTVIVGLIAVGVAERWGPTSERTGRLLDTEVGEYEVCRGQGAFERCEMVDTFEILGQFDDGSRFSKLGEDPYRAVWGETGPIQVTTSDLSGRVIALESSRGSWNEQPGMYLFVGILLLVFWAALVLTVETRRRNGEYDIGRFQRVEWIAVVPGMIFGLLLLVLLVVPTNLR